MDIESPQAGFSTLLELFIIILVSNLAVEVLQKGNWRDIRRQGLNQFEYVLKRLGFISAFALLVMPLDWYNAIMAKDDAGLPKDYDEQKSFLEHYSGMNSSIIPC